jgi:hypothetical protein
MGAVDGTVPLELLLWQRIYKTYIHLPNSNPPQIGF